MGSEEILNRIRSGAKGLVVLGLVLTLAPAIMIICMLFTGKLDGNIALVVIFGLLSVGGIIIMVLNMKIMSDPKRSSTIRKNPQVLAMADELCAHTIYRDNILLFSDRLIANALDLRQISYTDEIFLIYVYIHRTNGVVDQKLLKLETARNQTISLNIYRMKDPEIDNLIGNVVQHCRYARVGYNDAGFAYLKQMRELWKQDQARKSMPYGQ